MYRPVTRRLFTSGAVLLALFAMLAPRLALAQTTIVLDAPETEVIDAAVRAGSFATTNYAGQALATKASTDARRTLIKFNTETGIAKGADVASATLTLTVKGGDAGTRTVAAYRLISSFDEDVATWKTRKNGLAWDTQGGDLGAKYAEAAAGNAAGTTVSFNVTRLVQEIVDGTYEASRWTRIAIVDAGAASSTSTREFYSTEASDASVRPRLEVVLAGAGDTSTSGGALPSGWSSGDIGNPGAAGAATWSGTSFTVAGAGLDVWGTNDHFRLAYRTLTGDGSIVAEVDTVEDVDDWTKAGVMMRETLTSGSKHAFMLVSPGKGLAFQRRPTTGGLSEHTSGGSVGANRWVKVTRSGSTFTAYKSADGKNWTKVGSEKMNMTATIYVGLAVGSHLDGELASASFEGVSVTAESVVVPPPPADTEVPPPPPADDEEEPVPPPADDTDEEVPPPTTTKTLRVLQWNVYHGGRRTDGVTDPAGLAGWIAKFNPDVATLNEVDTVPQAEAILNALKAKMPGVPWKYYFLGHMKGNMILSRLRIEASSRCIVNTADDRQVAHVNVFVNGRPLNVWNAHLSLDRGDRLNETRAIQACERGWTEARIAAGDFNMQAGSAEYNSMVEGHVDAWKAAKALGSAKNFKGNCDGCTRNSRIDYVFTSKGASWLTLKSAEIIDTRNSRGVAASDHKPLLVIYGVK